MSNQRQLTESFVAACKSGSLATLTKLLASDVTAWADGGGKVRASLRPVSGQEIVTKRFLTLIRQVPADNVLFIEEINGAPAIVSWSDGHLNWVQTLDSFVERWSIPAKSESKFCIVLSSRTEAYLSFSLLEMTRGSVGEFPFACGLGPVVWSNERGNTLHPSILAEFSPDFMPPHNRAKTALFAGFKVSWKS